jgi:hypothetical protein
LFDGILDLLDFTVESRRTVSVVIEVRDVRCLFDGLTTFGTPTIFEKFFGVLNSVLCCGEVSFEILALFACFTEVGFEVLFVCLDLVHRRRTFGESLLDSSHPFIEIAEVLPSVVELIGLLGGRVPLFFSLLIAIFGFVCEFSGRLTRVLGFSLELLDLVFEGIALLFEIVEFLFDGRASLANRCEVQFVYLGIRDVFFGLFFETSDGFVVIVFLAL